MITAKCEIPYLPVSNFMHTLVLMFHQQTAATAGHLTWYCGTIRNVNNPKRQNYTIPNTKVGLCARNVGIVCSDADPISFQHQGDHGRDRPVRSYVTNAAGRLHRVVGPRTDAAVHPGNCLLGLLRSRDRARKERRGSVRTTQKLFSQSASPSHSPSPPLSVTGLPPWQWLPRIHQACQEKTTRTRKKAPSKTPAPDPGRPYQTSRPENRKKMGNPPHGQTR